MSPGEAYILLGSNMGQREQALARAAAELTSKLGVPVKQSQKYASQSWGFNGYEFLNQILVFKSQIDPFKLMMLLLSIENITGRVRTSQNGYTNRIIDIDLLYYGDMVINHPLLTLPHPRLHLRRFVLTPLVEIAPDLVHPVMQKTNSKLLDELDDQGQVWLYDSTPDNRNNAQHSL